MKKKIIFLELDGVLTPLIYMNALYRMWKQSGRQIKTNDSWGELFFDQSVQALKYLVNKCQDAVIVISQISPTPIDVQQIKKMWYERGMPGNPVSTLPTDQDVVDADLCDNIRHVYRGDKIKLWLMNHNLLGRCHYVVLNTTHGLLDEQLPHYVPVNDNYGLTHEDAESAIKILNK